MKLTQLNITDFIFIFFFVKNYEIRLTNKFFRVKLQKKKKLKLKKNYLLIKF